MLPIYLLVWPLLVRAAEFNSSVEVTVNAWSPMINLGDAYSILADGTAQRKDDGEGDVFFNWYFVGTDYRTSGTLQPGPNTTGSVLATNTQLGVLPPRTIILGESVGNSTGLGSISGLPLGAYTIAFRPEGDANVTFESLSYSIPVLTQAPAFADMQRQTHRAIGAADGSNKLGKGFSAHPRRSQKYLEQARTMSPWDIPPNATWTNANNGVMLEKATELTYEVPANTTLVNVTSAVGVGSECYAVLEPMPVWWNLKSVPMASQSKPHIPPHEQTLFMLPMDPTIRYNLTIGPFGNTTKCHIGGVTSYSFFYDPPPQKSLPTNATTAGPAMETNSTTLNPSSQNTGGSKRTNVGAIVGGVVGGVGGLLLLLLALWLLIRRRRKNEESLDNTQNGHPTVTAYTPPTTLSAQNSFVKGSPFSSSDSPPWPDSLAPSDRSAPETQQHQSGMPPEVEYAQDYEDVSNPPQRLVLPPRYREAWGGRDAADVGSEGDLDEVRILREAEQRATQLKRDVISVVDAKGGMSTV